MRRSERPTGLMAPILAAWIAVLAISAPHHAAAQALAPAPESATGRSAKTPQNTARDMVAAANPIAAEAGQRILAAGGSAIDAAITVQLDLNLVEPQSSGVGGGAFLLHWDGREVVSLDGRETAPAAARPDRFLGADGKPMEFFAAVVGGRSVGVPGVVKLLEMAHRRWGRLAWADVIAPAIRLAEEGFPISPRLNGLLAQDDYLRSDPIAKALFYQEDGTPKPVGTILRNPSLAATLRAISDGGSEAFYTGEIAQGVVAAVSSHPTNPGDMTLDDLRSYTVEERPPVCGSYRVYRICGMGPPSSGGIAVQQILGMLERFDIPAIPQGPEFVHLLSEAGRLAYADRALYVADPAYVQVPVRGLIDKDYLATRSALISPVRSMGRAKPGDPPFRKTFKWGPSQEVEAGTSHISVVDREGRAVSMTTTIETGFGAHVMTRDGFLLNNELTDFSFSPTEDGKPVANRVEPGKRPRSSMAPTLVFDDANRLYAVLGSPGGSMIINFVAKTLIGLLDWRLDPQVAADLPNVGSRNGPTEIERGTEAEAWIADLEAKGHVVRAIDMTSGIHAIVVGPSGLTGGADSRREGVAIGN
jgi:gamma-glutamyltranspeptidase/glutathione hydrolase